MYLQIFQSEFNHVDEKVGSKGGTNFKYLQQAYKSVHDSEEVQKIKRRKVEEWKSHYSLNQENVAWIASTKNYFLFFF